MGASVSQTVPAVDDFAAEWNAWHRRQEARLADPHGFLAITSRNWLIGEPQRFPDAPGEWSTGPSVAAGGPAPEGGTAGSASANVPPGHLVPRRPCTPTRQASNAAELARILGRRAAGEPRFRSG